MDDADASVHVERLSPRRRDDFLRFFDDPRGRAFAEHPAWSRCYCHFHEVPNTIAWDELTAGENRVAMAARIDAGEMDGFLAYGGDDVVGWLNAQPRHKLPHCWTRIGVEPPPLDVPAYAAAVVVCFVVAQAWPRRGVAKALLDAALASFAARGVAIVDAFPLRDESVVPADHYRGPLSLFRAAGFEAIGETADVVVMRKRLAPSAASGESP